MSLPPQSWQALQQSADRARQAANHEQAIDLYSQALAQSGLPWSEYCAMTMARAGIRQMLGETIRVDAELTSLAERAAMGGDDAARAAALIELALALRYWGDPKRGLQLAQEALQSAEKTGQPGLQAQALVAIGLNQVELSQNDEAQASLEAAQALVAPEDISGQMHTCRLESNLAMRLAQYQRGVQAGERGLQLARLAGKRDWEGAFLNNLSIATPDLAQQGSFWEQAQAAFEEIGDRLHQVMVMINRGGWLSALGLYERTIEVARQSLQISRAMGQDADVMFTMQYLGLALRETADLTGAKACLDEGLALAQKTNNPYMELSIQAIQAINMLYQELPQTALNILQKVLPLAEPLPAIIKAALAAYQAAAYRTLADGPEASKFARQAISLIDVKDYGNIDIPVDELYWWCYRGLASETATGPGEPVSEELRQVLNMGLQAVLAPVENMSDAGLRRGYLHRVQYRRLLIQEWLKRAADHAVGSEKLAAFTAQVQKPGRLNDIFRRLLAVGVRLNAQRDPARLPSEIVEEISELTGAERIALALFDEQGARRTAGIKLPRPPHPAVSGVVSPQPDPDAFLAEIEPWLDKAANTRQGFIHLLNPEGGLAEQRSLMVSPLISRGRLVGLIYTDLTGCFGRFDPDDLDLLGVLANQSAVALENANWSATLEQKVVERTAELKQSNDRLEQRASELAVINSIQQGLASRLNFQDIIDLVGDKITDIFAADGTSICLYSKADQLLHFPYFVESGIRLLEKPLAFGEGFTSRVISTKEPLLFNTMDEAVEIGGAVRVPLNSNQPDEREVESILAVPMITGDEATGAISVQSYKPYAYNESHLHLLSTLTASLGVALENARLFEETRQRASELAIINRMSQEMSRQLEVSAIVKTVGDQVRDTFHSEIVNIALYDPASNLIQLPYTFDRMYVSTPPFPLGSGLTSQVIRTRHPLVLKSFEEIAGGGAILTPNIPGDEQMPQSYLGVPIIVGEKAIGVIDVQSYQQRAYDESHVHLLSTLASSMGVALENARLFAETQRRMNELAVLSDIGQALSSTLQVDELLQLIYEQTSRVLYAENMLIGLYDAATDDVTFVFSHNIDDIQPGRRLPASQGLTGQIVRTRKPVFMRRTEVANHVPGEVIIGRPAAAWLGVPMLLSERVLGVIAVQHYSDPNTYDSSHR
ncbi:MAG: GAF domain-containing protein, partial [Omnitrophica WOR_2 bacterium]